MRKLAKDEAVKTSRATVIAPAAPLGKGVSSLPTKKRERSIKPDSNPLESKSSHVLEPRKMNLLDNASIFGECEAKESKLSTGTGS